MKRVLLYFCLVSLSLSRFLIADIENNSGIKIDQIYEKSLSSDGKIVAAKVIKGEETGLYLINTKLKNLIGTIDPLSPGSTRNVDITAAWNNSISKVAILGRYGRVGVYIELFALDLSGQFKRILFNYPREIEDNYKESRKDSNIFFRQRILGLGTWIDDNTVALIAGTYYEKNDDDITNITAYLVSFNLHITKNGKAEVQNIKVIGSLSMEEYETFKATHNYQFE